MYMYKRAMQCQDSQQVIHMLHSIWYILHTAYMYVYHSDSCGFGLFTPQMQDYTHWSKARKLPALPPPRTWRQTPGTFITHKKHSDISLSFQKINSIENFWLNVLRPQKNLQDGRGEEIANETPSGAAYKGSPPLQKYGELFEIERRQEEKETGGETH